MKFTARFAPLFACLLFFAGAPSASAQAPGQTFAGLVTYVRDGDTVELRTSTRKAVPHGLDGNNDGEACESLPGG